MQIDVSAANAKLQQSTPQEIVEWALQLGGRAIVTTNFGPFEAVILHMAAQLKPDISVVWIDSGYNLKNTYKFAESVIEQLKLNVTVFTPSVTAARQDYALGGIPSVEEEDAHAIFTERFKLEPFRRAMKTIQPDVWLTAVRREQTAFRQNMETVAQDGEGIIKVAPLLEWKESDMQAYLDQHGLPNELKYFDPTKALANRECGLHTKL